MKQTATKWNYHWNQFSVSLRVLTYHGSAPLLPQSPRSPHMSSKTCYLKEQQAAATFFFTLHHHSLLTFSPSYRPLSMHPTPSACQAAGCLENNAPIIAERGLAPPPHLSCWSPVGLAAASCSGLPGQRPDPRTTVLQPGARSSNDYPTATEAEPGRKQSAYGDRSQYLYFPAVR